MRSLAASAACAVLLGLAVSGLVRAHLSDLEAAAATDRQAQAAREPQGVSGQGGDANAKCCAHRESSAAVEAAGDLADARVSSRTRAASGRRRSGQPSRGARSSSQAQDLLAQELDRGIAKVGERRYEIKRRALDLALGNLALLSRSARVAPDVRAGRPFGFRLLAIAPDGPFGKLGLRAEDVLVSINGFALTTAEQVLDAYGKLKQASHLALGLVRDGHSTTLEYSIR